jgi:cytochrome P450
VQSVEAKVSAEATRVFGDATRVPTREAVDTMDYTLATLKEVLRLYSVVPVVTRVTVVRARRWRRRRVRDARQPPTDIPARFACAHPNHPGG